MVPFLTTENLDFEKTALMCCLLGESLQPCCWYKARRNFKAEDFTIPSTKK